MDINWFFVTWKYYNMQRMCAVPLEIVTNNNYSAKLKIQKEKEWMMDIPLSIRNSNNICTLSALLPVFFLVRRVIVLMIGDYDSAVWRHVNTSHQNSYVWVMMMMVMMVCMLSVNIANQWYDQENKWFILIWFHFEKTHRHTDTQISIKSKL